MNTLLDRLVKVRHGYLWLVLHDLTTAPSGRRKGLWASRGEADRGDAQAGR